MTVFLLLSIMASEADMFLDFSALARPLASAAFIQEFDHPEIPSTFSTMILSWRYWKTYRK